VYVLTLNSGLDLGGHIVRTRDVAASAAVVLLGAGLFAIAATGVGANENAPVEEIDTIGPEPPTREQTPADTEWPVLDGEPDRSDTALEALDVIQSSWVWAEIGTPADAKVLFSQRDGSTATVTLRVDPATSFDGWLPVRLESDTPRWDTGLDAPERATCSDTDSDGVEWEGRLRPYTVQNANVFTAVVDLATGCVVDLSMGQQEPPNANPDRGDFTVDYLPGYRSDEPTGPGD